MARKLFIVARGNVAVYESLQRSIRHEPGVEIIYDRRSETADARGGLLRRLRMPGRPDVPPSARAARERRRAHIDEELRTRGWAVVRDAGRAADVRPRAGGSLAPPPTPAPPREPPPIAPAREQERTWRPPDEVVRRRFTRRRVDDPAGTTAPNERDDEALPSPSWPLELPPGPSRVREVVHRVLVIALVVVGILVMVGCVVVFLMF
jgi:hypothetical protein